MKDKDDLDVSSFTEILIEFILNCVLVLFIFE